MASSYVDSLLITTFALALLWGVTALAVVLVLLRRRRLPHYYTPILGRTLLARRIRHKPRPNLIPQAILVQLRPPEAWIEADDETQPERPLPVISAQLLNSDEIAIHIEPDGSLSEEQRNIQRLIQHLQRLSPNKTRAAS